MFVTAVIFFAWAAASWFSQPFNHSFLNLILFEIDPVIPFIGFLLFLAGGIIIWFLRRGGSSLSKAWSWIGENSTALVLLVLILFAHVILQSPAVVMNYGAHDGDSALYGIAGFSIAAGESRPMYNLRKHHMGSFVPHITAVFDATFGKSSYYLRIVLIVFYLGFIALLFAIVKRLLDTRTALIAALLAAIPGKEIFKYLKHPENAVTLFLGVIVLLILVEILRRDYPEWRLFFWLGAVLGFGLWVNMQFLFYFGTVFFVLLIWNKLFFLKPAIYAAVPGLILGGIVIIVDGYYFNWPIIDFFTVQKLGSTDLFSRVVSGTSQFLSHLPIYLGVRADYIPNPFFKTDLFGGWLTWLVLVLFFAALIYYLFKDRKELAGIFTGKNIAVGPSLFTIFSAVIFLIFVFSKYTGPLAPMRYIFPIWTAVTVILARAIADLGKLRRYAMVIGASFFASVFLFSNLLETTIISIRNGWQTQWVEFLRAHDIKGFYGPWVRTYWTSYVTTEEIIGSPTYPLEWNPYIKFQGMVDHSGTNTAFLYDITQSFDMRHLTERLEAVGVSYNSMISEMGKVYYDFSERVTPAQLVQLDTDRYGAQMSGWRVRGKNARANRKERLWIVEASALNSGDAVWQSNAKNGIIELQVETAAGKQLRRIPISQDVEPGGEFTWMFLLSSGETGGEDVHMHVTANGFTINEKTTPMIIRFNDSPRIRMIEKKRFDRLLGKAKGNNYIDKDELFIDGWGWINRSEKGIARWSYGPESTVGIFLKRPRMQQVTTILSPLRTENMPKGPQWVHLLVNSKEMPFRIYLPKRRKLSFDIPASFLKRGLNLLTFRYLHVEPEFNPTKFDPRFRYRPRAMSISMLKIKPVKEKRHRPAKIKKQPAS